MNALESLSDDLLKWDFCDYILHKYQESLSDFFVCVLRSNCSLSSSLSIHSHLLEGTEVLGSLSSLPCQSAAWLHFVVGGKRGEKPQKAEMVNYSRFWRKIELEAFVVLMKIAHFLSAWSVGGQSAPEDRK